MWKNGNLFCSMLISKVIWILEWLIAVQVLPSCLGNPCPSNVQREAFSCFAGYSTQLLNMQKSTETLFTGVNVELLRAFCSSFTQSMNCIDNLKSKCPQNMHTKIEVTLVSFDGAREELKELCRDDALYEVYARHMTCFLSSASYSDRCFEDIMNTSVRLMKRIDNKSLPQLCRDFRKVLQCIDGIIKNSCGNEAAGLVPVLVKPMVRRSNLCELTQDDARDLTTTTVEQTTSTESVVITDSSRHRIQPRHNEDEEDIHSLGITPSYSFLAIIIVVLNVFFLIYGHR